MENEDTTAPLEVVDSAQLAHELASKTVALDTVTEQFMGQFVFADRSLAEWSAHLAVKIPKELTPEKLKNCYLEVANKIQQAMSLHAYATALHNALAQASTRKKSDMVRTLVDRYKQANAKRPGVKVLESLADAQLGDVISQQTVAKISKDFFRESRDALLEVRKCLEQYQFVMHMEQKLQE
jgi:hypothetical protein